MTDSNDFIPKPGAIKIGGLGRKAQKLQALRDKAAQGKTGTKPLNAASTNMKAKDSFANTKKTTFRARLFSFTSDGTQRAGRDEAKISEPIHNDAW
jgi:hypothetical protein